jgi:hypothetical protein
MSQIVLNEKLLSNKIKLEVLKNNDLLKIIDSYLKCRLCHNLSYADDSLLSGMCEDCVEGVLNTNYGGFNIRYRC